jgi:hypothetical protein
LVRKLPNILLPSFLPSLLASFFFLWLSFPLECKPQGPRGEKERERERERERMNPNYLERE